MTSKYGVANELIAGIDSQASEHNLEARDIQEATLVMLVQALKKQCGVEYVRGLLTYEIDSLGSGDMYEIARGLGHS